MDAHKLEEYNNLFWLSLFRKKIDSKATKKKADLSDTGVVNEQMINGNNE